MSRSGAWKTLPEDLGLAGRELVSVVGGGGKTSTVFALAAHRPGRTVVTTTTKMGSDRTDGLPTLVAPSDQELDAALGRDGAAIVWSAVDGHRALGVSGDDCGRWLALADTVAVEADGSRRKPFKAPLDYEPVVPAETTLLVACCGLAAVGAPIVDGCLRPERVAELVGCGVDDLLTPERLVDVLLSPEGSAKGRPSSARFAVVLNRVTAADVDAVEEITARIAASDPTVRVVSIAELAAPAG